MTPFEIGLVALAVMVVLVYAGMYVPLALMVVSYGAVWVMKGSPVLAGKLLALAASETITAFR